VHVLDSTGFSVGFSDGPGVTALFLESPINFQIQEVQLLLTLAQACAQSHASLTCKITVLVTPVISKPVTYRTHPPGVMCGQIGASPWFGAVFVLVLQRTKIIVKENIKILPGMIETEMSYLIDIINDEERAIPENRIPKKINIAIPDNVDQDKILEEAIKVHSAVYYIRTLIPPHIRAKMKEDEFVKAKKSQDPILSEIDFDDEEFKTYNHRPNTHKSTFPSRVYRPLAAE